MEKEEKIIQEVKNALDNDKYKFKFEEGAYDSFRIFDNNDKYEVTLKFYKDPKISDNLDFRISFDSIPYIDSIFKDFEKIYEKAFEKGKLIPSKDIRLSFINFEFLYKKVKLVDALWKYKIGDMEYSFYIHIYRIGNFDILNIKHPIDFSYQLKLLYKCCNLFKIEVDDFFLIAKDYEKGKLIMGNMAYDHSGVLSSSYSRKLRRKTNIQNFLIKLDHFN